MSEATPVKLLRSSPDDEAKPEIVTLQQFLEEKYEAPEPLLAPWLRKGDLSMVYAPPGAGKTWFTLGVAWAVATGSPFGTWNGHGYREDAKPHRVLVMDFEMAIGELQERLRVIKERATPWVSEQAERKGQENLSVYAITRLEPGQGINDLSRAPDCETLIEKAEPFDLIIIDNLSTSMKADDENNAQSFHELQKALIELRRKGKAVILVHHTNKNGDQRGSSAKTTILNTVLKLTKMQHASGNSFGVSIEFEKHRSLVGDERSPVDIWVSVNESGEEQWGWRRKDDDVLNAVVRWVRSGLCKNQGEIAEMVQAETREKTTQQMISDYKQQIIDAGLMKQVIWGQCLGRARSDLEAPAKRLHALRELQGQSI